ncbi:uncharacterized protein BP5553_00216 [Venustampulla echinocandica]|uniref:Uncharacterized protein n=1 Tax=Venustampulla echinocandica TaxID=2656787 RepID=A0A370TXI1_9HELO|nr:uncharacterized protein BP5553_00216 [Venustampulla echinocandica]RDL40237.1 hypothetical protein BP5553_00216 [Venustampulla echinocandica]
MELDNGASLFRVYYYDNITGNKWLHHIKVSAESTVETVKLQIKDAILSRRPAGYENFEIALTKIYAIEVRQWDRSKMAEWEWIGEPEC